MGGFGVLKLRRNNYKEGFLFCIMYEVIFLICLALVWIVFATIQDIRTREVANWLNFSLIIFALGFRFFYSLFSEVGFGFFYQGLIGLGIFFVLGNALYYGRMFAGGDAKLMVALGAILPFSEIFKINLRIFIMFFVIFLFVGAFYGLIVSLCFGLKNFNKFKSEFSKRLKSKRKLIYPFMFLGVVLMILGFLENLIFYFGFFIFILPYFYLYAKSVEEVCMIKKIKTKYLTEGDWLYNDLKVGNKTIKTSWDGLSKKEIGLIKKMHKEVKIKQGIQFVPVFLISFLIFVYFYFSGESWNPLWKHCLALLPAQGLPIYFY